MIDDQSEENLIPVCKVISLSDYGLPKEIKSDTGGNVITETFFYSAKNGI